MASLNTLRTKGGVFLTVVIVIALILFIIPSDANFFGGSNDPRIGEIDGNKVKYSDFYNEQRKEEVIMKSMYGDAAVSGDQMEALRNAVWARFIMNLAYRPGFDNMGLMVSEEEQIDMVGGVYISPVILAWFSDRETGQFNPVMLQSFVDATAMDPSGGMTLAWHSIQDQMNYQRLYAKYISMIEGGMNVSGLEIEQGLLADNNKYSVRVLAQPYSLIADSLITVSDSEIRDYYTKHKAQFKQGESRDIEYVAFDIRPSAQDMEAGEKKAAEWAEGLANAENPISYVTLNSPDDRTPPPFVRVADIKEDIAKVVLNDPAAVYGPVLEGTTYTIARLGETRMLPDSMTLYHILLAPTAGALADSLEGVLNRGGDFEALAREYSEDANTAKAGGLYENMDISYMVYQEPNMAEAILNSKVGSVFQYRTDEGIHIMKVAKRSPLVKKARVATMKYTVKASSATSASVMAQARDFYGKAKGSAVNFENAAGELGLTTREANIKNTERSVAGMPNSVQLMRWAFDNKNNKNAVSEPIEIGSNMLVVATLTGVNKEGYAPVEKVAEGVRKAVLTQKKGEELAKKMQGASLDEIAAALGAEVKELTDVKLNRTSIPGVGSEPKLVGAIGVTEMGKLSKPVIGSTGVYLFEVTGVEVGENTTADEARVRLESTMTTRMNERVEKALMDESEIVDNRARYF